MTVLTERFTRAVDYARIAHAAQLRNGNPRAPVSTTRLELRRRTVTEAKDDPLSSKHYYELTEAVDDVSLALGAKETSVAAAKLAGKTLFNVALFSGKLGWEAVKNLPGAMAKNGQKVLDDNPDMPVEKRERMEQFIAKHGKDPR